MKKLLCISMLVAALCPLRGADGRPNILFIMSDDHAAHALSAYGGRLASVAPTPNLDRLAREGARFANAFVCNSICAPSRATIMTGKHSHRNGVYKFTRLDQSQPTLPKYLRAHGYQTGFVGKWHLQSNPVGFEHWSVLPGQGRYLNTAFVEMVSAHVSGLVGKGRRTTYKGWHSTDIITKKALDWFQQERDGKRPFFYMLHYKAPHDLWKCAPRYEQYLADVEIPEPDTLFDHGSGRSPALDRSEQAIGGPARHTHFTPEIAAMKDEKARRRVAYQEYMKRYLRCVKGVDDNLGKVLAYLDESGLAENTVVIYTADQGFFLGEHGLFDKRFMYEESLRIPLLVRWPGKVKAGMVIDELVLNLDLPETMLDLAGHPVPKDMQGRSFVPLLNGQGAGDWRDAFYYRYYPSHFNTPRHFGIRTARHKLIYFDEMKHWELFDLRTDPTETNNLAADRGSSSLRASLKRRLLQLQKEAGDKPADIGDHPW